MEACRPRGGVGERGNFRTHALTHSPPVETPLESHQHPANRKMPRLQLTRLAHARSGDKGDTANVGLIALRPEFYPVLRDAVTAERAEAHFRGICHGGVERFELPNLGALNFLLHNALGGGGTVSLKTDAQGKVLSTALLRMEIDVPEDIARLVAERNTGVPA